MNWKNGVIIVLIFGVVAGSIGLAVHLSSSKPTTRDVRTVRSGVIATVSGASNQFGIDYYSRLTGQQQGNIFFSPFSISSALAMTYEGARGVTANEMRSVMHFPVNAQTRQSAYALLFAQLNGDSKDYTLKTANALWVEKTYPLLSAYTETIKANYGGNAENVDFVSNAEDARLTINQWVADQTNNKIPHLFSNPLDPLTRLVLTNAVYFKGKWSTPFDPAGTKNADFARADGTKVTTKMMAQTDGEFDYAENSTLQMIRLPYNGNALSMEILLPKNKNISSLEKQLTADKLVTWENSLQHQSVDVYIPKFTFSTGYDMGSDLAAMGMKSAFLDSADFSGIDGSKDLFISQVIHKAFIDVNEEGTEAAAATGVAISLGSAAPLQKPKVFRADHPFIFLIQDKASATILFIGRVADPSA